MTFKEWGKKFQDKEYQIIQQTTLPNRKWVSTVWLGMDHSLDEDIPLIFETMVFPEKGSYIDEDLERYSTLEQAVEGHKKMCDKWSKKK